MGIFAEENWAETMASTYMRENKLRYKNELGLEQRDGCFKRQASRSARDVRKRIYARSQKTHGLLCIEIKAAVKKEDRVGEHKPNARHNRRPKNPI